MEQRKKIILCVDDELNSLILRKHVLEKCGFKVIMAASGAEAIRILESRDIDLVLSDLLMPGMTGTELAQWVKTSRPELPVVLISGVNELPEQVRIADLFVSKLEGPETLTQRIAEVFAAKA